MSFWRQAFGGVHVRQLNIRLAWSAADRPDLHFQRSEEKRDQGTHCAWSLSQADLLLQYRAVGNSEQLCVTASCVALAATFRHWPESPVSNHLAVIAWQ